MAYDMNTDNLENSKYNGYASLQWPKNIENLLI